MRPIAGLTAVALLIAALGGYAIQTDSGSGGNSAIVSGHSPGITAEVVRKGTSGTLHLTDLRQIPNGKILQAWVQRGSRVVSTHSLFAPDLNGRATAAIPDMQGVNTVMVTVEPRGVAPSRPRLRSSVSRCPSSVSVFFEGSVVACKAPCRRLAKSRRKAICTAESAERPPRQQRRIIRRFQ